MPDSPAPIRVNRAPVLTLWAAVVAERQGHPPDTALSLASAVAGTAAHAKARRLGIAEDQATASATTHTKLPSAERQVVRLLGRDVPVVRADGQVLALGKDGKVAAAAPVANYLRRAFGTRLLEARAAMVALAARLPPEELNRVGFRLYEQFRPEVPEGVTGWGTKGELHLERIDAATA